MVEYYKEGIWTGLNWEGERCNFVLFSVEGPDIDVEDSASIRGRITDGLSQFKTVSCISGFANDRMVAPKALAGWNDA